MESKKSTDKTFIFCVLLAFLTLLFTSGSSFLFITNNWDDVNSYFTIGKGMMNGLVIYRDLYDQKGPYLYLLNGIAYLISHRTFAGVFIFEVIAASFANLLIYKTELFFCRKSTALVLLPFVSAAMYSSQSFYKGGAAEEYCLPFLLYSIYVLIGISGITEKPNKKTLIRQFFLTGLFAGIISLIKYTMLGFFMGFAIVAFLFLIIGKETLSDIFKLILVFLSGYVIAFVPWILYLGFNNALDDLYRCYVYNNIFFYSALSENTASPVSRLEVLAKYALWLVIDNLAYFVWIFIGFIGMLMTKGNIVKKLFLPFVFAMTFIVIFFGGNTLPYYSIPLMAFTATGAGMIGMLLDRIIKNPPAWYMKTALVTSVIAVFIASLVCVNADYRKQSKDDFWLMEFKDIVELKEDPTLLNLGGIDAGLFAVTGIVPSVEYFQTNGIALPEMFEAQEEYIKEGRTTFILVCNFAYDHLELHYEQVAKASYDGETYYLYEKVR